MLRAAAGGWAGMAWREEGNVFYSALVGCIIWRRVARVRSDRCGHVVAGEETGVKVKDLAWGAYVVWVRSAHAPVYQPLATSGKFLSRLQSNPRLKEFEALREFLVHFGVPWAPKDLAKRYLPLWPRLKPHVHRLAGQRLEECDLNDAAIQNAIQGAYDCFYLWSWGGDVVASKVLHFFNTRLFVMWDSAIWARYHAGKSGSKAYLEFLRVMQEEAIEVLKDFKALGLHGGPEQWLSRQLGYKGVRPLTKLIDDYNLVTVRDRLSMATDWPEGAPQWLEGL